MKRFTSLALLLLMVVAAALWSRSQVGPPAPALLGEIVQGGHYYPIEPGVELGLERERFDFWFIVEGYRAEAPYAIQLAADERPAPTDSACFDPGHSLAIEPGGYTSFNLSWDCGHYLYYDPESPGDSSVTLVKPVEANHFWVQWTVTRFQRWSIEEPLTPLDWAEVPDLHLLLNHPERGQVPFSIRWTTPAR